jgi:ribosomal protein S18 acetylase RimI-like enzyme
MADETLLITKADITDAAILTTLSVTTFIDTFGKDNAREDMDKYVAEEMNEAKITEELRDECSLFFLAWHNGILAGYAKIRTGKIPAGLEKNKPMELERIYVLNEYLGKKIGAALMSLCLTYAISNGHDILWLGVWGENYRAINFYRKWGFELFGTHHFKLGDDLQTDVLMKKTL